MNADNNQISVLKNEIRNFDTPEDINDSSETAPSKRLEKIFIGYSKTTDGMRIAEKIGIQKMMQKCPCFKAWIETIISTANTLRGIS